MHIYFKKYKSREEKMMPTLVPEVFLDFSLHERAVRSRKAADTSCKVVTKKKVFLSCHFVTRVCHFAALLAVSSHAEKNQEKPLGPR